MRNVAVAFAAIAFAGGCTQEPEPSAEHQRLLETQAQALADQLEHTKDNPATRNELVIRLAFGQEADLDLYVTDPLAESIYFANRDASSGGKLARDVRCDGPERRIEEVRFAAPLPGRYRVGVDHPSQCDGGNSPAAFAISVEGGGVTQHASGTIEHAQFQVIVMEFEVSP
jgi:uncharacterized protein YfaP (DUF2135 family)